MSYRRENADQPHVRAVIDLASPGDTVEVEGVCVDGFEVTRGITLVGRSTSSYPMPTLDGGGASTVLTLTEAGRALVTAPDGSPNDVDREVFELFTVMNENLSPFLRQNLRRFAEPPYPRDPDGDERCVACNLCAVACPVGCISLQKAERPEDDEADPPEGRALAAADLGEQRPLSERHGRMAIESVELEQFASSGIAYVAKVWCVIYVKP